MGQNDILPLFDQWNDALKTDNPERVAALYASDAVLLPTVSNQVRRNQEEITDYFINFLAKNPSGKIDSANVRTFGDLAINSGIYTFTFNDGETVQARYTFVYKWNGQDWKIIEHHSSAMPE